MKKLFDEHDTDFFIPNEEPKVVSNVEETPRELTKEEQEHLNKAYSDLLNKGAIQNPVIKTVNFSEKKGKVIFDIGGTVLEPSRLTMIGKGSFVSRYVKQLESLIFTESSDINPDNLIPLIMLYQASNNGTKTIRIVSGKNKTLLKSIVEGLNIFYKEQHSVLSGMFTMFKNTTEQQLQAARNEQ